MKLKEINDIIELRVLIGNFIHRQGQSEYDLVFKKIKEIVERKEKQKKNDT